MVLTGDGLRPSFDFQLIGDLVAGVKYNHVAFLKSRDDFGFNTVILADLYSAREPDFD